MATWTLSAIALLPMAALQPSSTYQLPRPQPNPAARASGAESMQRYQERLSGSDVILDMVPIPASESLELEPFWMAATETTWDLYHLFMLSERPEDDIDGVSRPTPPYVPMDFGMGTRGFPAISMTQFAARQFTKWLSYRTGRFYRLPSEAEWAWACRAGATREDSAPGAVASPSGKASPAYQPVASLEANPWGLYDMIGNVAEWTLDRFEPEPPNGVTRWPTQEYPRAVRGGSFEDDRADIGCGSRRGSSENWKISDPQFPQSIWYHTDAPFVGFRVVRPLQQPSPESWSRFWDPDVAAIRRVFERQRQ